MENNLYDRIVVEFQKGEMSVASGMMDKVDIDTLRNLHDHSIETVIGDLAKTLENAIIERSKQD
jgi:hypothetical protein